MVKAKTDTRVVSARVSISIGSETAAFEAGAPVCDATPKMVKELERLDLLTKAPSPNGKGA